MTITLSRAVKQLKTPLRVMTGSLRMLPSVLIIGSQKAGTTSLYRYLLEHPQMLAPSRKEIGFFDIHFARGLGWYRSRFPLRRPWHAFTLEASTGYLDHPHAPSNIRLMLPNAKLLVLVREPVDRAYSHYLHTVRIGYEQLTFEEAIDCEEARTHALYDQMEADPSFYPREINYFSYLRRGRYAEHLEHWFSLFPREQLLVLRTEDLALTPGRVLDTVWDFIGLNSVQPVHFSRHNVAPERSQDLAADTRARLEKYFAPHNRQLERLVGRSFNWGRQNDFDTRQD